MLLSLAFHSSLTQCGPLFSRIWKICRVEDGNCFAYFRWIEPSWTSETIYIIDMSIIENCNVIRLKNHQIDPLLFIKLNSVSIIKKTVLKTSFFGYWSLKLFCISLLQFVKESRVILLQSWGEINTDKMIWIWNTKASHSLQDNKVYVK